jgi:hypothetical protein
VKLILSILVLCAACAQAQSPRRVSDREHDGFVGPVKKVFEEWSPLDQSADDIPAGTRCRRMTNEYDEHGRLTRHSVYPGICGSDEIREDYAYAPDGSQTKKREQILGKNSPPPPPRPAPPPGTVEERGEPKAVFKYDDAGRRVEEAGVRPSGKVFYKITYGYDAKGRLTELTTYNGDGRVSTRRVYTYTGDDRVPSGSTFYLDGKDEVYESSVYTDYEFNSRGDWVKRRQTSELPRSRRSVSMNFREIEYYQNKR